MPSTLTTETATAEARIGGHSIHLFLIKGSWHARFLASREFSRKVRISSGCCISPQLRRMVRCAIRSMLISDVRREEETGVEPLDRLRDIQCEPLSASRGFRERTGD